MLLAQANLVQFMCIVVRMDANMDQKMLYHEQVGSWMVVGM